MGDYFRLKRACSKESVFESQITALDERLYQQGYKKWHTNRARHRVNNRNRESLLFGQTNKSHNTDSNNVPTFSTAYSVDFAKVKNIFLKYLPMLNRDDKLRGILREGCRCVAKRGSSLGNILSPSDLSSTNNGRTWLF